jgi:hypothetical protein
MSTKADYSTDQWKAISDAPMAAGMLISLADMSGPIAMAKEAMAVGRAIIDSATGDAPDVAKALAASVKEGGGRPRVPDVWSGDRAKTTEALLGAINLAVAAVAQQSPGEVHAYKTWLVGVATKVAEAAKEGGFLGFGGTPVSTGEQEGLEHLRRALGLTT